MAWPCNSILTAFDDILLLIEILIELLENIEETSMDGYNDRMLKETNGRGSKSRYFKLYFVICEPGPPMLHSNNNVS